MIDSVFCMWALYGELILSIYACEIARKSCRSATSKTEFGYVSNTHQLQIISLLRWPILKHTLYVSAFDFATWDDSLLKESDQAALTTLAAKYSPVFLFSTTQNKERQQEKSVKLANHDSPVVSLFSLATDWLAAAAATKSHLSCAYLCRFLRRRHLRAF